MRKDTRVGVAIGLVLFLVLIVYAIAVPKSSKKVVTLDKKGKVASAVEDPSARGTPLKAETSANSGSATGELPNDVGAANTTIALKDPPADNAASNTNWAALLSAQDKLDSAGLRTHTPDMAQPDGASPRSGGSRATGEITGKTGTSRTEAAGTHRVAENETFASIARSVYGDVKYADAIAKANPSIDPRRLRPGMTIRLPDKSATADSATLASGNVKAGATPK
ncbi:MAG TPA: LysM domain-containing protein, partial [Humisphaera sp.]|nr:LysM domain-containing protein [Humisphaera sp.]